MTNKSCEREISGLWLGAMKKQIDIKQVVDKAGGMYELARVLDTNYQTIQFWIKKNRIPAERVIAVEHASGIPRERLRPDLFLAPRPKNLA